MTAQKISASLLVVAVLLPAAIARPQGFQDPYGIESLNDIDNVAPIREQILKEEEWLRWRQEWNGQDVRIVLEQNVAMTEDRLIFLGGRQVEWYVVK